MISAYFFILKLQNLTASTFGPNIHFSIEIIIKYLVCKLIENDITIEIKTVNTNLKVPRNNHFFLSRLIFD